jgi:hypothetical protein
MSPAVLKRHLRIFPYRFEYHEKHFKREGRLESQIKIIHEGTRLVCPVYQKPFVDKTVMKRHIENVHEKKAKCL